MSELRLPTHLSKPSFVDSFNKSKCVLGQRIAGWGPITVHRSSLPDQNQPLVAKVAVIGQNEAKDSLQEAKILARLSHPYLVKYVHSYVDGKKLYLIMEYCEGGDLRKVIHYQLRKPENLFGTDVVLGWFTQLCLALQYIHKQNILHRDVTPSNIFLAADGTIKLGDFGLAKILSQTRTCRGEDDHFLYQPPEVTLGSHEVTSKCDMFAVGCVLYELCTGFQPFQSASRSQSLRNSYRGVYKNLPHCHSDDLRALVNKLLSPNPNNRPSADQVLKSRFLKRFVIHFSPEDTGSAMSVRDEMTSTGQSVSEVLQSIRVAMSSEDDDPPESDIKAPPNTPNTPVERSFSFISPLLKRDSPACHWYDTGRKSSGSTAEVYRPALDKESCVHLSRRSRYSSPNLSKKITEANGENLLCKSKRDTKSMSTNLLKLLEPFTNSARERPSSTS